MAETGSETEEDDKLALEVEDDALLNGAGSPASLMHADASPAPGSRGSRTKEDEEDDEDEMRDSGVEHIWQDSDMLSASVDGTGQRSRSVATICVTSSSRRGFGGLGVGLVVTGPGGRMRCYYYSYYL